MDLRTIDKHEFSTGLQNIPDPPEQLWMRGSFPIAGTKLLAVVGSRALTRYGRESCEYLISGLAGYPVSIISGLAIGADACAHRAALDVGLHTIAIPGSGLDETVLYPRSNLGLARKILEADGAWLSEHEPEHKACPWDFPSRNRIMVGLADAVLMIEAGEKSGTLITARLAGEYGRHLLCVPHPIKGTHSSGSHAFIREGATLVSEPEHILEALGIEPKSSIQTALPLLSEIERTLYELLDEGYSRDAILHNIKLDVGEVLSALTTLELQGLIKETSGIWHRI